MKTLSAAIIFVLAAAGSAYAFEVRAGISNVQVRDQAFNRLADELDDVLDIGPWTFHNAFHIQGAMEVFKNVDVVGALRYGTEQGVLQGVETRLLLLEPGVGLRRRFAVHKSFDVYGQAMLAGQYAETTFFASGKDPTYRAAFATLTPAVGATFFPLLERKRNWGVSGEVGYSTPAPLRFGEREGVSPGTLNYGGITYGFFVVFRADASAPKKNEPVAQPVEPVLIEPEVEVEK